MRLNPEKTESMVFSPSRTSAPGYGDLTLGGAELEEKQSLRIRGVIFDSKLTIKMNLRELVSLAVGDLGVVCRAGKLFDCPRVLKSAQRLYQHIFFVQLGCRRRRLICVCLIALLAVRKDCVRVKFVLWGTEERRVPCVCSTRLITG